ncbi:DUF3999 family protein, partial [Anaeromyxobacter oryzisoli]|uniref:DUF3999 family protein n=1 Tax=Anaeromyxobacter oryzisoli TaxID=2925408 RepID=UPI001F576865
MSRPAAALLAVALLAAPDAARAADPAGAPALDRFAIHPAGAGLQRLEVPPAYLSASASGDLSDLRLADRAGREVPYLLVPPPEQAPRWVPAARVRPIPRTRLESGDEADLGEVREVAGVRLEYAPCLLFQKRARIEGSGDGRRWTTLAEGETLYALATEGRDGCAPGDRLVRDTVRFAPARVRWLRAVLDDRRTPRLSPLRAAAALLADGVPSPARPRVALRVEPRPSEPGTSRYALVLPGPHLPVRGIVLTTTTPRVSRSARVLEQRLAGDQLAPVELGAAVLVRSERDGVVATQLAVPVATPEELELELVVEDGENPPLADLAADAELAPAAALVFESADGAPLEARLGAPDLRAPRYDLEALRPGLGRLRPATARAG